MMRVVLLLAIAACSNLGSIEPNQCGNGVLEPGEDCDDPGDPSCVACSVACSSDDDCLTHIPATRNAMAYRCGYDQPQRLCHAPGGTFVEVGDPRPYDVLGFGVVDIDGDHIGDAVGLAPTQALVRYGDRSTPLAVESQAVVPTLLGSPAVGDINGDQAIDVVMPTRDGLVAYTGTQGALVPYLLAIMFNATGNPMNALHSVQIDDQYSYVFFARSGALWGGVVSVTQGGQAGGGAPTLVPLCDQMFDPSAFNATDVSSYDVTAVYGGKPTIMIALEAARTDGTTELCAFTVEEIAGATPTFPITQLLSATVTASGRPTLAQLDAATMCPALVSADRNRYAGSAVSSSCQLATTPLPIIDAPMQPSFGIVVGRVPLVPAIAGAAPDALVLEYSVEAYAPGNNELSPLYVSDEKLAMSAFGDFDGDGRTDAVVISAGVSDFDVLHRLGSSTNGIMFLRARFGTDNAVKGVLTGDFDGNSFSDVLVVEDVPDQATGQHRDVVAIAYGTADQVLAPVEVGAFGTVLSAAKVQLFDSIDQAGVVDDLAVIDLRLGIPTTLLGMLHGTPQRGLVPYLDPRPGTPLAPAYLSSAFAAVAEGRFVTSEPAGVVDLLAISAADPGPGTIWRLAGSGRGIISAPGPGGSTFASIDAGICMPGQPLPTLCADASHLVSYPLADHDVVVALDPIHGYGLVIDPTVIAGNPMQPDQTLALTPGAPIMTNAAQVSSVVLADSDGDGTLELIFAYATNDNAHPGDVRSCKVSASGLDCSRDLFANEPLLAGQCFGVAKGAVTLQGQTADSGPQTSLVLACAGGVVRLDYAADGYHAVPLVELPAISTFFDVGDVTGDLVPDFVLIESRAVRVFQQCTSRGCP